MMVRACRHNNNDQTNEIAAHEKHAIGKETQFFFSRFLHFRVSVVTSLYEVYLQFFLSLLLLQYLRSRNNNV